MEMILPLFLVGLVLSVIAISTNVTIANVVLFEINLPYAIQGALGIIRSSGRMFWPVSYMLILAGFAVVVKGASVRKAVIILLVIVSLQVIDLYPWYRNVGFDELSWESPLKSPAWNRLMEETDHVAFVPAHKYDSAFIPFAFLASTSGSTINIGPTARANLEDRDEYRANLLQEFSDGELEDSTLYIIRDDEYLLTPQSHNDFTWGLIDGYAVIAPKTDSVELSPWPD
jgi:hypothetical protein